MKKILLLTAAAIIAFGFSSCKKDKDDDDNNNNNNAAIVGTWMYSSVEIKSIEATPQSFKDEIRDKVVQTIPNELSGKVFIFNEDGTGIDPEGENFVYTYSGSILTMTYKKDTENERIDSVPVVVTKNTLAVQASLYSADFGIIEDDLPDEYSFTVCIFDMIFTK